MKLSKSWHWYGSFTVLVLKNRFCRVNLILAVFSAYWTQLASLIGSNIFHFRRNWIGQDEWATVALLNTLNFALPCNDVYGSDICFNQYEVNFIQYAEAVLLNSCPYCPSCPVHAIQTGSAIWAIWARMKKYSVSKPNWCDIDPIEPSPKYWSKWDYLHLLFSVDHTTQANLMSDASEICLEVPSAHSIQAFIRPLRENDIYDFCVLFEFEFLFHD